MLLGMQHTLEVKKKIEKFFNKLEWNKKKQKKKVKKIFYIKVADGDRTR